jgi:hypothetical protein
MSRDQIKKLLGGYATGSLTPEESQALCEAALEDQELFDALAREQSLKDLLADPAARGELLAALGDSQPAWWMRAARWSLGNSVGLASIAGILLVTGYAGWQMHVNAPKPRIIAVMDGQSITVDGSAPEPADKPLLATRQFAPPRVVMPAPAVIAPPEVARKLPEAPQLLARNLAPPIIAVPVPAPPPPAPKAMAVLQTEVEASSPAAGFPDAATLDRAMRGAYGGGVSGGAVGGVMNGSSFRPQTLPVSQPASQGARQVYYAGLRANAAPVPLEAKDASTVKARSVTSGGGGGGAAPARAASPLVMAKATANPPAAPAPASANSRLGVRVQILRKAAGGEFEPVDPNASFAAGDVIQLRVEPNQECYAAVFENGAGAAVLAEARLAQMARATTREIRLSAPGDRTLLVAFSRRAGLNPKAVPPAPPVVEVNSGEEAIYAVSPEGDGAGAYFHPVTLVVK